MKCFKMNGMTLYLAEDREAQVHYVPEIHWDLYVEHRHNTPVLCRIFRTIEEAHWSAVVMHEIDKHYTRPTHSIKEPIFIRSGRVGRIYG